MVYDLIHIASYHICTWVETYGRYIRFHTHQKSHTFSHILIRLLSRWTCLKVPVSIAPGCENCLIYEKCYPFIEHLIFAMVTKHRPVYKLQLQF